MQTLEYWLILVAMILGICSFLSGLYLSRMVKPLIMALRDANGRIDIAHKRLTWIARSNGLKNWQWSDEEIEQVQLDILNNVDTKTQSKH